jgi:LAO/AO transport system kinase
VTGAAPTVDDLAAGIASRDRLALARAITLVESRLPEHQQRAQDLLVRILDRTGGAMRVAMTGPPGVGKSTVIEALGLQLADEGRSVAVLAIDPSSAISGGSILGDKTRMARLAQHERAFIRPSPAASTLGGVARRTRESMLLCEAAGFDVVLVETVGVGQSETAVSEMVDTFVLLVLPGAGDELQGIKKGIVELADVIAVNKADGDSLPRAREAKRAYSAAVRLLSPRRGGGAPEVLLVSGLTGSGIGELWSAAERHRAELERIGALETLRREQRRRWMWSIVDERLHDALLAHPDVQSKVAIVEASVVEGKTTATLGAEEILAAFGLLPGGRARSGRTGSRE